MELRRIAKQNIFVGGRMQKSKRKAEIMNTISNIVLLCSLRNKS